jgi:hypothetical protein
MPRAFPYQSRGIPPATTELPALESWFNQLPEIAPRAKAAPVQTGMVGYAPPKTNLPALESWYWQGVEIAPRAKNPPIREGLWIKNPFPTTLPSLESWFNQLLDQVFRAKPPLQTGMTTWEPLRTFLPSLESWAQQQRDPAAPVKRPVITGEQGWDDYAAWHVSTVFVNVDHYFCQPPEPVRSRATTYWLTSNNVVDGSLSTCGFSVLYYHTLLCSM